jgi:hypothetical protein
MILQNRMWIGAAAGAGFQSVYGDDSRPLGDRMTEGVVGGATIAALANPSAMDMLKGIGRASYRAPGMAGKAGWSYGSGMAKNFSNLNKAGVPAWKAGLHSFGRAPVLMGAGAAVGAAIDSDDRKRGAMIGAGVGAAARLAIAAPQAWKQVAGNPIKKLGFIGGLSAIAYAGGEYMSQAPPSAEAERDIDGGYNERAPGSGVKDRLAAMGATGDVVFGAHARRRG